MRLCFIYMYSYAIRMSLVWTHMSSVCHSYILIRHPYVTRMYSYVTGMSLVCTCSYAICMSLACTRMPLVCHSCLLVCHSYVTRMYSYVIRMSLVSTRMYSYVIHMSLVCGFTMNPQNALNLLWFLWNILTCQRGELMLALIMFSNFYVPRNSLAILYMLGAIFSIPTAIVWNTHLIIFSFRARSISRRNFLKPTYHSLPRIP